MSQRSWFLLAPITVFAVAVLVAAPSCRRKPAVEVPLPAEPMSYLVTPTGHRFRMLGMAPVVDANGRKLGTVVAYAGDTRVVATAVSSAAELVASMGPQFQMQGDTSIVVQDRVGIDPVMLMSISTAFNVTFQFEDGGWRMLPLGPGPQSIGTGRLEVTDDPRFPFDANGLVEAGREADIWMTALGSGDTGRLLTEMSEGYATAVASAKGDFERFVRRRKVSGANARHRELYRLQTRNGGRALPGGRGILVLFDSDAGLFGRSLEQVGLVPEKGRWRVCSFLSNSFRHP